MRSIRGLGLAALGLLAACADRGPLAPDPRAAPPSNAQRFECIARVRERTVACATRAPLSSRLRGAIIGGQGQYVNLSTTNVAWDSVSGTFSGDVAVQNLLPYAMGTLDGVNPDPAGIRVFFHTGPTVTSGWGSVSVQNPDGVGVFTAASQPYFQYPGILAPTAVTAPKTWEFHVDPGVAFFAFTLYVSVHTAPTLVISEIMAHPGTASEPAGEWFEVYNRSNDAIDLQGWTIASGGDSAHTIATSVVVPVHGYVVLGASADPAANGGAAVQYVYTGIDLANGTGDWLALHAPAGFTADSVDWGAAAAEAPLPPPTGASLELDSLDADNLYLSGESSHWTVAAAAFGSGQKGTPGGRRLVPLRAVAIAASYSRTCAVDPDGQAWCWGFNYRGTLGIGPAPDSAYPTPMRVVQPAGVQFTALVAGLFNTCALATTGVEYCWGNPVTTGTSLVVRSTAVAVPSSATFGALGGLSTYDVGTAGCALDSSGLPWCWGSTRPTPTPEPAPGPLAQLLLSDFSACARTTSGQAWCRSGNGPGDDTLSLVSQPGVTFQWLDANERLACGISTIGQMLCWDPAVRVPSIVPHPPTVQFTSVAVEGPENVCAVATTGVVWCKGGNDAGQLGDGTVTPRSTLGPVLQPPGVLFSAVALARALNDPASFQACALKTGSGDVYCWGHNHQGQVGDGTTTNRLAPVPVYR